MKLFMNLSFSLHISNEKLQIFKNNEIKNNIFEKLFIYYLKNIKNIKVFFLKMFLFY